MTIVFRTDASLLIGTGHVMRCLTLADALKTQGAECHFICRDHPGHLIGQIEAQGHRVHTIPCATATADSDVPPAADRPSDDSPLAHAGWLGASQAEDAAACAEILRPVKPDWLIVDHYALDARWEQPLQPHCRKLMVIDDLADRRHVCDLLLDQNLGRRAPDYDGLIPVHGTRLIGPKYALLRPEFAALREYSLKRRSTPQLKRLLITMGGIDKDNATGWILDALKTCPLPDDCRLDVIMGTGAPWLEQVRLQAATMPWPTDVLVNITDMAQRMAESDLAIGAAGSTSWERCCLGLPTLLMVLAENQREVAEGLEKLGAAYVIKGPPLSGESFHAALTSLVSSAVKRSAMSHAASCVTDGSGLRSVMRYLESDTSIPEPPQLRLRPMTHADLDRVLAWRNHENVRRFMFTQHEISRSEHSHWFEQASRDSRRHLLVFESDAVPLGFINLHQAAPDTIDWGFYAAPDAPKGTGLNLGHTVLEYVFGTLGMHKLCAQALTNNERSIRLHQRLGFTQENSLHQRYFDGEHYHDIIRFSLTASDWRQSR